ncbi:hypothetical protein RRF57_012893 [Xylaria bambusicola]|uniref:Uncharacterized protein n=1 Tax=Xylaria bambusicola TaxID=326684 RepID=A0AAN7V137_9PEZI
MNSNDGGHQKSVSSKIHALDGISDGILSVVRAEEDPEADKSNASNGKIQIEDPKESAPEMVVQPEESLTIARLPVEQISLQ